MLLLRILSRWSLDMTKPGFRPLVDLAIGQPSPGPRERQIGFALWGLVDGCAFGFEQADHVALKLDGDVFLA